MTTREPRRPRRGHGRVTLQDVASAAGCTAITVSRFLREPAKVAPATAERIRAALLAQAYVPNRQAGVLASGRSRMVAAIVPSIANSVFADTLQGLADGLLGSGYELMLASSGYSLEREEEQLRAVLAWAPAAIAVTGRHHTAASLSMLEAAAAAGTPVVEMWDRQAEGARFTQVGFDHARVGREMAQHLLASGFRLLAYVDTGVDADFRAHERGQAFLAEARKAGARARMRVAPTGDAFEAGRSALAQLLDRQGRPQVRAAAFANDHLACGAWLEASRRGLQVPTDIALMGFGDFPLSRQLGNGLTSVRPPRLEIGRAAAELILARLSAEPTAGTEPVELTCVLVGRTSTQGPASSP
jgi:LacI family gluconate utilization system Gnt-I transcriptional repressor